MKAFHSLFRHRKELLLAGCFVAATPAIAARIAGIDGAVMIGSYLALLGMLWVALLSAAYIPLALLRWGTALLLAVSAFYMQVFEGVTTQFMTYDAFINLMNSAAFAGDALAQNRAAFLAGLPGTLLLLAAIGMGPQRTLPLPGWMTMLAPWAGAAALTGLLFLRGGDGARGLPQSFTPIAYLALAGYEEATGDLGPREPVKLPIAGRPLSRKIVLIVDESIAGQYLDINSSEGVPTPLSRAWPGIGIHNYGLAAAVTNCSVGTNVTLRHGGTRNDYQRINATMPPIWAYARKAGLQTVYIDAQRTGGALQNLMTEDERRLIDRFVQFDRVPVQQRDMAAAEALIRELADPAPKFILVNKVGAHFPVHDKYPDAYMAYRPALPRGRMTGITDTGSRKGFGGSAEDWRRYRNAYRNTLLWNVGVFFERLLTRADLADATLIYTSDHGQNLHERGNPGTFTHCTADPAPEEGAVPLLVIEGAETSGIDWSRKLASHRNRTSHYRIFPTLLALMGYDTAATGKVYGHALTADEADPSTFNRLFNARLNRKPDWLAIDADRLQRPPVSDFKAELQRPGLAQAR